MTRYLSGVQPSGTPHLGNYFGAIKPHVEQSKNLKDGDSALFFIADLHAMTTFSGGAALKEQVRGIASTYLALGLDTSRAVFFRQSDVPEVTELSWMLACCTNVGLLQRAHSYKDKVAKGLSANAGLFTYPILMAADILIYQSDLIPVGKDQVQHVEMAKDMATHFNQTFADGREILRHPEATLSETPCVVGTDGQKMSKSYGNAIDIFAEGNPLDKAINAIVTDSRPPEEPKVAADINLFNILKCFLTAEEQDSLKHRLAKGGFGTPGYGELKKRLKIRMNEEFNAGREQYNYYMNSEQGKEEVEEVLVEGARQARHLARETLSKCYEAAGFSNRARVL